MFNWGAGGWAPLASACPAGLRNRSVLSTFSNEWLCCPSFSHSERTEQLIKGCHMLHLSVFDLKGNTVCLWNYRVIDSKFAFMKWKKSIPVKSIVASLHPHTLAILCVYNDENFTSSKCFKYFLVKLLKVSLIHLDNWFVSFGLGKGHGFACEIFVGIPRSCFRWDHLRLLQLHK